MEPALHGSLQADLDSTTRSTQVFRRTRLSLSPSPATRALNTNSFAPYQPNIELPRLPFSRAILSHYPRLPAGSFASVVESPGASFAPVRKQRHFCIAQNLNLSHYAVPSREFPLSATPWTERILRYPEWIGVLQSLYRRVQRICHMRVHAGNPGLTRSRSHASRNRLVIRERLIGARIDSADRQVIHRPRGCCGNTVWNCLGQCSQQHIYYSLRGFDITTGHRGRRPRIHHRPFRSDHLDRPHQSRCRRNVVSQQATKNIEACGISDRRHCVDAALHLRIRTTEIDDNRTLRTLRYADLHCNLDGRG